MDAYSRVSILVNQRRDQVVVVLALPVVGVTGAAQGLDQGRLADLTRAIPGGRRRRDGVLERAECDAGVAFRPAGERATRPG